MSFISRFYGPFYDYLGHVADDTLMAQRAIAQNIANANNPNYHPVHVEFEQELQRELRDKMPFLSFQLTPQGQVQPLEENLQVKLTGFDPEFMEQSAHYTPKVIRDSKGKVDLNYEMAKMAQLQFIDGLQYDTLNPAWARFAFETLSK